MIQHSWFFSLSCWRRLAGDQSWLSIKMTGWLGGRKGMVDCHRFGINRRKSKSKRTTSIAKKTTTANHLNPITFDHVSHYPLSKIYCNIYSVQSWLQNQCCLYLNMVPIFYGTDEKGKSDGDMKIWLLWQLHWGRLQKVNISPRKWKNRQQAENIQTFHSHIIFILFLQIKTKKGIAMPGFKIG